MPTSPPSRLAPEGGRVAAVAVRSVEGLDAAIKWGHLVYSTGGPVLLIRAEEERVLFGFWRGRRLTSIEPRLRPGGKYEMATLELRQGMTMAPASAAGPRSGGAHPVIG